jgi:hypothetical protein
MQCHGILKTATWNDEAFLSEFHNTVGTTASKVYNKGLTVQSHCNPQAGKIK